MVLTWCQKYLQKLKTDKVGTKNYLIDALEETPFLRLETNDKTEKHLTNLHSNLNAPENHVRRTNISPGYFFYVHIREPKKANCHNMGKNGIHLSLEVLNGNATKDLHHIGMVILLCLIDVNEEQKQHLNTHLVHKRFVY